MDYATSSARGSNGSSARTVTVVVQVVDLEAVTLELTVPSYLPAQDLSQRIVKDAGLGAYWEDGSRRLYWLRARGRLMRDDENLDDMGVIDGELVYLLPEPPRDSGIVEQDPDYPETHDYAGSGIPTLLLTLMLVVGWSIAWGVALTISSSIWLVIPPAIGLGLLCTNFGRHAWGGSGSRPVVVVTALVLALMMMILAAAVALGMDPIGRRLELVIPDEIVTYDLTSLFRAMAPGFISGIVGVFIGWLSWWGAVEPLPPRQVKPVEQVQQTVQAVPCGICSGDVTPDVLQPCPYNCGQAFHIGCHRARVSVYRGDNRFCPVCNARVA
ncbi:MAG: hypothetical protein AAFV53_08635 [Myxococcota bacterium]